MKQNPIYVISKDGQPLMPTERYGKVRHMIKNKQAKIIKRDPFFTIQLLKDSSDFTQPLKAGMDIGETIGLSVINGTTEILSAELQTRSKKISKKIKEKSSYRRTRRNKLRHRKVRFDNRGASKGTCKHCGGNSQSGKMFCRKCLKEVDGIHQKYSKDSKTYNEKRLAPSVRHLVDTHTKIKDEISAILPLKSKDWIIEKTKFDIQKMENNDTQGVDYQQGDMFGFYSLRDYILDRDNHMCQNPNCKHKKGKTEKDLKKENPYLKKGVILVRHHIVYRSQGGTNKPSNLITLCIDCHTSKNHQPGHILWDWCISKKKVTSNYKAATKMNVVASAFNDNKEVSFTFGSETKGKRQLLKLDKSHSNDAFSICLDESLFEIVINDDGKKQVQLKQNISFDKIEIPLILKQTNGRENGRRSLQTFSDARYIDARDGLVKTGKELSKNMNKRTPIENGNDRIHRLVKTKKGSFVNRNGRSQFPNNSIIEFKIDGKKLILEGGGMTKKNVCVKGYEKDTLAYIKYSGKVLCNRSGIIKENFKKL